MTTLPSPVRHVSPVALASVRVTTVEPRRTVALTLPLRRLKPLTVTLAHTGGTNEDVTRDPRTTYERIGKTVPRQVEDAIYQKINAALAQMEARQTVGEASPSPASSAGQAAVATSAGGRN